jgi:hypothetical protein
MVTAVRFHGCSPFWGQRTACAAKRGLPPIPAFGIGWLYPVCPTDTSPNSATPFFIPPDDVLPHNATGTEFPAQFAAVNVH